jgi:hypothetical protein
MFLQYRSAALVLSITPYIALRIVA